MHPYTKKILSSFFPNTHTYKYTSMGGQGTGKQCEIYLPQDRQTLVDFDRFGCKDFESVNGAIEFAMEAISADEVEGSRVEFRPDSQGDGVKDSVDSGTEFALLDEGETVEIDGGGHVVIDGEQGAKDGIEDGEVAGLGVQDQGDVQLVRASRAPRGGRDVQ